MSDQDVRDWLRDNPTRPDGTPLTFAEARSRVTVQRMRQTGAYRDSPARRTADGALKPPPRAGGGATLPARQDPDWIRSQLAVVSGLDNAWAVKFRDDMTRRLDELEADSPAGLGVRLGEARRASLTLAQRFALRRVNAKSPEPMRELWRGHGRNVPIADAAYKRGAFYRRGEGVSFDAATEVEADAWNERFGVLLHEIGHGVDDALGSGGRTASTLAKLDELLAEDFATMHEPRLQDAARALAEADGVEWGRGSARQYAAQALANEVRTASAQSERAYAALSDAVESVTGIRMRFGHMGATLSYWTSGSRSKEFFANVVSALYTNPAALAKLREYFPTAVKAVEGIIAKAP